MTGRADSYLIELGSGLSQHEQIEVNCHLIILSAQVDVLYLLYVGGLIIPKIC
jgi:hypothetical protein